MSRVKHWTTGEVTLSGIEAGSGELVLLLHGFPAYHKTWERYLDPLAGAGFHAVAVDMRGYFESSKPRGVAAYSMRAVVSDLVNLVTHLGHTSVRLVGHDWGGAIAWAMASWHPELVSRVAVYNCPHPQAMAYHLRHNRRQLRRSWYILLFQIPWLPEWLIRWRPHDFIRQAFRASPGTFDEADLDDYRLALERPGVLTAAINYYRAAAADQFLKPHYPPIACPSLLFWGTRDSALGQELIEGMERYLEGPHERFLYPRNGHWTANELAQTSLPALLKFLLAG